MYKMQLLSIYNEDLLMEEIYDDEEKILEIIDSFEKREGNLDIYISNMNRSVLLREYVFHSVINEDDGIVYRLFFKVKIKVAAPLGIIF